MKERDLHKQVASFLDVSLPAGSYWFPIPNGKPSNRYAAFNMKKSGELKVGIPDICVINRGRSIFIELKVGYRKPTPIQTQCHEALTLAGAVVKVCKSLPEVEGFLNAFIPEIRGSVTA